MIASSPRARTIILTDAGTAAFSASLAEYDGTVVVTTPDPSFTANPSITGTPRVGQALSSLTYTDATPAAGTTISARAYLLAGVSKALTYVLVQADLGKMIALENTGTGATGTTPAVVTSPALTVIAASAPSLTLSNATVSTIEGDTGTKLVSHVLTLNRDGSSAAYTYSGNITGAVNAADFGGTLPTFSGTFATSETTKPISYLISGDTAVEPDEAYVVLISGLGLNTVTANGTISNDDVTTPTVTLSSAISQAEGNTGTTLYTYTVTRSTAIGAVLVPWALTAGTTSADDFLGGVIPTGGNVSMADGVATGTITIGVNGETVVESNETFTVLISTPSAYVAGAAMSATGTILNDDVAGTAPTLFGFTDDFAGDGPLRKRSGWQAWGNDWRDKNALAAVSGQGGKIGAASFGSAFLAVVDVGRVDTQIVEYTTGAAGLLNGALFAADENNYLSIRQQATTTAMQRYVNGVSTTITIGNRTAAAADVWRFERTGSSVILFINGTRYPNATTTFDISALPLSGRVGFHNSQGAAPTETLAVSYGTTALPRVTLDVVRRGFQRAAATGASAPIAIGGACSGVAGLEIRVENAVTGTVVTGWDWGQKALTNVTIGSTSYTATVPAGIPAGDGYRLRIRATNDNNAASNSRPFGIGITLLVYGQSNGVGLAGGGTAIAAAATVAQFDAQTTAFDPQEDNFSGGGSLTTGPASIGNALSAASGLPVFLINRSVSGQTMDVLRPGSSSLQGSTGKNAWTLVTETIAALGGDVEGMVFVHGEGDAGATVNTTTLSFTGASITVYKSGLDDIYAALKAVTGRTAAQLPLMLSGLGRIANAVQGEAQSPNWGAMHRVQYEYARNTVGASLIDSGMDIPMAGQNPDWHYVQGAAGYGELGKRVGQGVSRVLGFATTDRRGALLTGIARSGSTIALTFAANGTTGLTCAAAVATNFFFFTDNTYATPIVPTGMIIDNATQVTYTFGSAVPAGAVMRHTQAGNPDVANFLKSTYSDGSVMVWPGDAFAGIVTP